MAIRAQIYLRSTQSQVQDGSKHIHVRHVRVREYVEHDEMEVKWVGTKEMLGDGFIKTFPGPALSDLRNKLHLRESCFDIC